MEPSSQNGKEKGLTSSIPEAGLSKRRAQLNRKLGDLKTLEEKSVKQSKSDSSGYAQAMKLSSEFIAGVLVGTGMGWVFDQWLGTSPFGLIVFLLLGFAAGVLNVLRSAGVVEQQKFTAPDDAKRRDQED